MILIVIRDHQDADRAPARCPLLWRFICLRLHESRERTSPRSVPVASAVRLTAAAAPPTQAAAAGKVAAGVLTGAYEATRFKAKPKLSPLESVQVLTAGDAGRANAAMDAAAAFAAGTGVARSGPPRPPPAPGHDGVRKPSAAVLHWCRRSASGRNAGLLRF